jgi:hypothetical protein
MPQIFGWQHIVYLLVCILVGAGTIVLIKLKVKEEKHIDYIVKGVGGVLLCLLVWNRILLAVHNGILGIIPNTFCGLTSLLFALAAIFLKRGNIAYHCLVYISIWGCLLTMIYPDFIGQAESIFYPLTISGLLHHSVSLYLSILMIVTGFFKPTLRKFYAFPIGLSLYMTYGVFLEDCVGLEEAMYINEPLIEGTIFTWYFVGVLMMIITIAILATYEYIQKKFGKKAQPQQEQMS